MTKDLFTDLSMKANYSKVVFDDYKEENKGKIYRSFIIDDKNSKLFANENEVDTFLQLLSEKHGL